MKNIVKYSKVFFLVFHGTINLSWISRSLFLGSVIGDFLETTANQIEIKEELKPDSNDLDFNYSDPLTTSFIKQDVEEYEQGTYFLKISNSEFFFRLLRFKYFWNMIFFIVMVFYHMVLFYAKYLLIFYLVDFGSKVFFRTPVPL